MACISPATKKIAYLVEENRLASEATGATLFGPDSAQWPGWWFDAIVLHKRYLEMEQSAFQEAALKDR